MPTLHNGKRGLSDREITKRQILQEEKRLQDIDAKEKLDKKNSKKPSEETIARSDEAKRFGKKQKVQREYSSFKRNLRESLLTEAIYNIYSQCIPQQMTESLSKKGMDIAQMEKGFITDFIRENGGPNTIIDKMSRKNVLLSEYANIINKTYYSIMEDTDKETSETFGVTGGMKTQFYDSINQTTPENVIEVIKSRVSDSIGDFLDENRNTKSMIIDVCNQAQSKAATTDNDALKENANLKAQMKIRDYKDSKPTTILGEVVKNIARQIVKNPDLKDQYTTEDGRLDMDSIVECSVIYYGLLETVNSLQLVDWDQEDIDIMLKNMR